MAAMISVYSPNMLKTYDKCAKQFYYKYVEKLAVPTFSNIFDKGKNIHALANYYKQGLNIDRIQNALTPDELSVWEILLKNPYFKMKTYKTEYSIMTKVTDFWIGGRLDAVVFNGNDYYILDYKTGNLPQNPKYDFQTMVYLLSLKRILPNDTNLSFVYIDLKNSENKITQYNKELEQEYTNLIINICSKIEKESVYNPSEGNCKNCEYKHLCKF